MRAIRWLPAVIVVAVLASLVLAAVLPGGAPLPGVSIGPAPSIRPTPFATPASPTPAPTMGLPIGRASYVGPAYDRNLVTEPTKWSSQSKLWFNDDSWWGLLVSEGTGHVHIHALDWESQRWIDTGVVVDERPFIRYEAFSDGASLYVVGSGSRNASTHAVRMSRFGYDAESRRYLLQPDFPRTLTQRGVGAVSITKAGDGRVWLAYVQDRQPQLTYSTTDGVTWIPPFTVPVPQATNATERAAIVATNDGVAVAWTSLNEDQLHLAQHVDGDDDDAWSVHSMTVEGMTYGDDEISLRAVADGSMLVAVRTSLDRVQNRNLDAPKVVLGRLAGDEWRQAVVARIRDGHAAPQLLVDDVREQVYVFAAAGGDIYVKRADIETLAFDSGPGTLVIQAPSADSATPTEAPAATASPTDSGTPGPAEPIVPAMADVSSTKQSLDGLSEIVVIASDDATGRYSHAVVSLPGGREAPVADGHLAPPPEGEASGLPAGATTFLFRDSFTPFEAGPATVSGWETRDNPADEVMTIAVPNDGDPSLRLAPNELGSGPRACKSFAPATSGVLIASATVQARGTPDSDATITTLRSPDGQIVTVRFGEPGTFRYFLGDERITTEVPYQSGAWYRSVVTLDLGAQTYDWEVVPLGSAAPVLSVAGSPLRVPALSVGELCVQSANELSGAGVELYIDDVSVEVGPGG